MAIDYTKNMSGVDTQSNIDAGLKSYFLGIYAYMAGALAVTGIVAYLFAGFMQTQGFMSFLQSAPWIQYVIAFAPLAYLFIVGGRMMKMSLANAQLAFWTFAIIMGVSLSYIFLAYTSESIAKSFFITAGTFGFMSLYGYTTKRDLSKMGSFLMMGVIGIIIASVVNIFLASSALSFAISMIAVVCFTGLMAWDTQKLKRLYFEVSHDAVMLKKVAITGALSLYLDVINLFVHLLHLLGDRR